MNSRIRIRDIEDGTSNTMMISETFASAPMCSELPASNGTCNNPCTTVHKKNKSGNQQGYSWFWGQRFESHYYSTTYTPNPKVPDCGAGSGTTTGTLSARSKHVGGVHVLLGDGGVRFASSNLNLKLWRNLGHPQDANVLGEW